MSTWKWLESTRQLQEDYFGVDYADMGPDEMADYVTMNHSACVVELSEFMQEVGWKNWAEPRGWVNREAALKELVDAAHFLANLASAIGVTDAEWEKAYQAKQEINRQRQRNGYDGRDKCSECGRAFDDGASRVIHGGQDLCLDCVALTR